MWTAVLIQLGLSIFRALPIERIVAMLVNKLLNKMSTGSDYNKALTSLSHLEEISEKLRIILEDAEVKDDELQILRSVYTQDIAAIIELWSKGKSAKELESKVALSQVA
jgi:hypothetical protein